MQLLVQIGLNFSYRSPLNVATPKTGHGAKVSKTKYFLMDRGEIILSL